MTEIKQIEGFVMNNIGAIKQDVIIRFTSDSIGESLSFQSGDTMILVKYNDIEDFVNEVRKKSKR